MFLIIQPGFLVRTKIACVASVPERAICHVSLASEDSGRAKSCMVGQSEIDVSSTLFSDWRRYVPFTLLSPSLRHQSESQH